MNTIIAIKERMERALIGVAYMQIILIPIGFGVFVKDLAMLRLLEPLAPLAYVIGFAALSVLISWSALSITLLIGFTISSFSFHIKVRHI